MFETIAATAAATGAAGNQAQQANSTVNFIVGLFQKIDWSWVLIFALTAFLVFGCLLLAVLFIKRWQVPRLGFFLFTAVNVAVRILRPADRFWNIAAMAGAAAATVLVISLFIGKNKKMDMKEPVYYLLNVVSLLIVTSEINFYMMTMAILCLFASLFFINTSNRFSHRQRGTREADPAILESLEKRARKRR